MSDPDHADRVANAMERGAPLLEIRTGIAIWKSGTTWFWRVSRGGRAFAAGSDRALWRCVYMACQRFGVDLWRVAFRALLAEASDPSRKTSCADTTE